MKNKFFWEMTHIFINALSVEASYVSYVLRFLTQHVLQASLLLIFLRSFIFENACPLHRLLYCSFRLRQ